MSDNAYYSGKLRADLAHNGYYAEKMVFFEKTLQHLSETRKKPLLILDIGCNDGILAKRYSRYGNVIGIDINKQALDNAVKKKNIQYICSDLAGIKNKFPRYFDVVIAGDIIEHIFDTDRFLQDIRFVLKKGGSLLLTTPNVASFGRRIMLLLGLNPFLEYSVLLPYPEINCGHIRYYTDSDLRNQLMAHTFRISRFEGNKINLMPGLSLGYSVARYLARYSVSLMVQAEKL